MNKLEQDKLKIFMKDEILYTAVKKTFLSVIGDTFNFHSDSTDEVIGQQTRAKGEAIELLKKGFKQLETYKEVEYNETDKNKNNPH